VKDNLCLSFFVSEVWDDVFKNIDSVASINAPSIHISIPALLDTDAATKHCGRYISQLRGHSLNLNNGSRAITDITFSIYNAS
jgi:hypothetical protein